MIDPQAAAAVAVPVVSAIVWLTRLEGRINLLEARHADIKEMLDDIRHDVKKILGGL